MYSLVLMAALTAGGDVPSCHHCCGCYGGGWGCCGCYGGCYGCYGGCMGCWGGCYGGCMGCWGGCYGGCMGCMGCYGGFGYGGGAAVYPGTVYGGTVVPGTTVPGGTAPYGGEALPPPGDGGTRKKEGTMLNNRAKLLVELPANSKLYIDDKPMKTASGVRSFNTPELEPGQAYYYIVRVETERDGKPVSETRRVIVRAGQIARADFKDLESEAVRTARAK